MPSKFELYKQTLNRDLDTDYNELKRLYNQYPEYYKNYGFAEFAAISTENSEEPLDAEIQSVINAPIIPDKAKDNPDYYKELFDKAREEEIRTSDKPFPEWRRVYTNIFDELATGSAQFLRDATKLTTAGKITGPFLPSDQEIQDGVNKVLNNELTGDIYDKIIDEKGNVTYQLQDPKTTAGSITSTIGSIAAAMYGSKKGIVQPAKNLYTKIKGVPTPKRGRPSKADIKKRKLLKGAETLGTAELGAQIIWADDPEVLLVGNYLSNAFGNDDNLVADLFKYLDADEDSTALQRRLSLLLDGVAFTGVFAAAKVTKDVVMKALNKVKKGGDQSVVKFKQLVNYNRKQPKATKTSTKNTKEIKEKSINDVVLLNDKKGFGNGIIRIMQQARANFFSTTGYFTPEMHKIIKGNEYDKLAWSRRAANLTKNLNYQIKKISQEKNVSTQELDEVLRYYLTGTKRKGKKVDLRSIHPDLRDFAVEAKETVKDLSEMLLETKNIPADLRRKINSNLGQYLRKTYEIYENPKFTPSQEVIETATREIAKVLSKTKGFLRYSPQELQTEATSIVNKILSRKDKSAFTSFTDHMNQILGTKTAGKLFAPRKNISPAINALLGGDKVDTTSSVFRSIENLSHYITDAQMFDELYHTGKGKWWFTESGKYGKAPDARMKAAKVSGERFLSLNNNGKGFYTTKEIASFFEELGQIKEKGWVGKLYAHLLALKGFGQASATVYNLITHVRNTVGGAIILAQNGMNPFSKETAESFNMLRNELFTKTKNKDKALQDLYIDYQRLGLVNQNVRVGEFKKMINELAETRIYDGYVDSAWSKLGRVGRSMKQLNRKVTDTYIAEDDLWRITGYNKELKVLKEANDLLPISERLTEDQLKEQAATIIRNTMPTYDLIPKGFRDVRYTPIGNFFSFSAERWRNNYHTIKQSISEIRSGNEVLVKRGYQRLASTVAVGYTGGKGVSEFTKYAFGVTEEEEKAVKDLALPTWSKNSQIAYSRDENGNLMYIDLSYTDPNAPVLDTIRAGLNVLLDPNTPEKDIDRRILGATYASLNKAAEPFISLNLLSKAVLDVTRGGIDSETNRPIPGYNELEGAFDINNIVAITRHLGQVIIPAEARYLYSVAAGERGRKLRKGELDANLEIMAKLTGQRFYKLDKKSLEKNFYFKMKDFNNANEKANGLLWRNIGKDKSIDKVLNDYIYANQSYFDEYVNAKLAVEGARTLGIDSATIFNTIKSQARYLDSDAKSSLAQQSNYFEPLKYTDSMLRRIYNENKFTETTYDDFKKAYGLLYTKMSQLPLVQFDELTEEQEENYEIIEGGAVDWMLRYLKVKSPLGSIVEEND